MRGASAAVIVPHGKQLHIEPATVDFVDIQADMKYIQTVTVRNLSPVVKRIRVEPPSSPEFKLLCENQRAIAPGLSISIDVEFLTRKPFDYVDRLIIKAEDFRFEVSLSAKGPCAAIEFAPLVNFGEVMTKRAHQEEILFRNEGSDVGSFDIKAPADKRLTFTPVSGRLQPHGRPGDSQRVKVQLLSDSPCTVHEVVEVKLDGQSSLVPATRSIDVHGTCVNQALHLYKDGAPVKMLNFGSLYHGQSKVITVELRNDGPTTCSFSAQVADESDGSNSKGALASSPAETMAKSNMPLVVTPFTGSVPAFGKIPLEFIFAPNVYSEDKGFICNRRPTNHCMRLSYSGKIECEELGLTLHLQLAAEAILPALRVSPDMLQFGQCQVNQRRDIVLRITNLADSMPLDFEIPTVPHMAVKPAKGRLSPQQNMNVIVSYMPKSLGRLKQDLQIKYCGGMYRYSIAAMGEAPTIGEKAIPARGLERTGRDFDPEHCFVDPENLKLPPPPIKNLQSITKIMKTDLNKAGQRSANNSEALDSIMQDHPEPTQHSLSPSAMQEFVRNKQKFNTFLKESRLARKKNVQSAGAPGTVVDIFCEDDVDRGMAPGSGLKSPRYNVDEIKPEKLYLQRPLDDDNAARGVTGLRYVHDENKLIKKKFKAAPTTQAEVRECSATLENWQLGLISVGPRIVDFGSVYVRSQATKSFSVYNDLPQAILVTMQYDSEELSRSNPVSQVIPSAQAAGFDLAVSSHLSQTFQRQVVYTINGIHAFKLLVKAEITPVTIKMSRSDLNFRFSDDNLDRTLTEQMVLSNLGNAPARFSWQGAGAAFSVGPTSGVIRPGGTCPCEVVFAPPSGGQPVEGVLTLKTEDGDDQLLSCSGQVPEAVCAFQVKKLDLGVLAVGLAQERSVSVVNTGKNTAVFHVEPTVDGVTVTPTRGRIVPEGRADIEISVRLDKPMQLETMVSLSIRGGKTIRLQTTATAVVPNIEFVEDEIEFGQLTLGAIATAPVSLKNSSAVEGTLYVNLQPYAEFALAPLEVDGREEDDGFDASSMQALSAQQYQVAVGQGGDDPLHARRSHENSTMIAGANIAEDEEEDSDTRMWKITVQPNYTLQLQLTYQPADLGQHYFEFPVLAAGGGKSEGLRKVVHAEALRPRMLFSSTVLDFKTKVVSTGIQSIASVQELALHNADDRPIEWKIDSEPLRKHMGVFALEPVHGTLEPESDCRIRVAFLPNEPIEYRTSLNVFLSPPGDGPQDGEPPVPDESKPYLSLRLKGQGAVPKLTFDRKEVVLPIVPLGIRSRCLFHITNEGYESLDVKVRLPTDNIRIPLTINFPEGQTVGITKPKIPVEVFFQSNKPISFCAKLEFLDNDTGSYTLPISGTTENSILTCHHYLQQNVEFYTLEGYPVTLTEKEDSPEAGVGAPPSIKTGSMSHAGSLAGYGGQDLSQVEYIMRWMNGNVLKNQMESFPQDLVNTNGRFLYEMIEFLSGKTVSLKVGQEKALSSRGDKGKGQKGKDIQRIHGQVQQYEQLLNFLKQHGALLSPVRPEHFLSYEQYLRLQQNSNATVSRRQVEKMFFPKSVEAWLTVILQTIKIFLLNRITLKAFRSLPGMTEEIDQPIASAVTDDPAVSAELTGTETKKVTASVELVAALDPKGLGDSNVYGPAESILLRWLNFHFWRASRERYPERQVTNFDSDLSDSVVLSVVIQSHVPNCQAVQQMRYPCTAMEHYEENAGLIIAALSEIGLAFPIQVSDIASAQSKDMLLFVMYLFQNLPHYVPKTTIVFSTMLGVSMTKNIELTNPSKKAITYNVQLQGSSDFSIKDDQIRIEPKQTVSFPVEFHSRFSRLVEGQIVFTSKREGNVHAAAMVFKLRSKCTGRKPRKTVNVSAVLYETGTVDVDLENPFSEDAEFTMSMRESTVMDLDRNPIKSKRCENVEPFHVAEKRARVKANGTTKLTISFLPFEAPAHFTALLGFFDSKAGEFYYELCGVSSPPLPLETYKLQVKADEQGTKELILPHRNTQMEAARTRLEQRGLAAKMTPPDSITYDVTLSSPFYTAPKQVTVVSHSSTSKTLAVTTEKDPRSAAQPSGGRKASVTGGATQDMKNSTSGGSVAKLTLEFRPKDPGVYPCTVTLTSDVDIRIYQIEGTGTAPNTHCFLTFNTQARKYLTQEIPIVNPTEREWQIKPVFAQSGHEFDGPRDFVAKKRQANGQATTTYYPLVFKPDWVCDVKAQLVLHNAGTNEAYEYDLHGISEEPLAEEQVIIKCEARQKASHVFAVRNYSAGPATFEVESDLVNISGPSSITVEGRGQGEYELVFQPLQAGQVTGCIMFRDAHSGHFTWYTVECVTLPPKPQQTLNLACVTRQAVAVDIQLVNPLDDVVVFEVALTGDGLLGESEFVLAPKETATYELVFSPLLPAKRKGSAVFFNDVVGEFWYDLDLLAEAAPPEELETLNVELGQTGVLSVTIDNPTGQEVVLKHRSTNKINFKVVQQKVVLPPLESTTVQIEYSPSSLGVVEEAQIIFEHSVVGQWVYKATGIGLSPDEPRKVTVAAQVHHPISQTISFKNPFLESIHAFIVLESRSEKGVFSLLNKKAKVQIGPLATAQIPFSFCPPSMTQHSATVAISVAKPNLTWTYHIQGVAEAPTDATVHTFTVMARESLETYYHLSLVGLDSSPGDRLDDALSCRLEVPPQHQALVDKCFAIGLEDDTEQATVLFMDKEKVSLKVNFSPLRPFVALCNLVITRASGGRWRFDLKLEATEPEVDDTILIQSPLNKPASVAFRLSNHKSVYSGFDAFFDAESAYEFTVQPTSGVLEPAGSNGTTFVITYKPMEYGKPVQGKLIIQTEDVYWSYIVKGTHPKYTAPVADKPTVETRLSKEVLQKQAVAHANRRKKNFIRNNMAGGPSSPQA